MSTIVTDTITGKSTATTITIGSTPVVSASANSMTIRGEEGKLMKITAYFLIRGDSIEPLLKCNDDAECYTWTKVNYPFSHDDKAKITEYWTSETTLERESLLDSRVYK